MPQMVSLKDHEYPIFGPKYKVGDKFEADDSDVTLLTAIGRAKIADGSMQPAKPAQNYQTRVMTSAKTTTAKKQVSKAPAKTGRKAH